MKTINTLGDIVDAEIKFRAWHINEKVMCPIQVITDTGAFLFGAMKGEDSVTDDGKSVVMAPDEGRFCRYSEIEVMQYTGIKDANGNDFYEGDYYSFDKAGIEVPRPFENIRNLTYLHYEKDLHDGEFYIFGNIYEGMSD